MRRQFPHWPRLLDSVRARLTLIIVLAMLPAVAFSVAGAVRQYAERKDLAERELLRIAELMPHEVGAVFSSAEQLMLAARLQSVVALGQLPACREVLAGALAGRDLFGNIWIVDATGVPVCSARELARAESYAEAAWFQAQQRLRAFAVSAPAAGDTTFVAALPLTEESPRDPVGVAVVSIKTTLLQRFARIASVSDDTGVFLLRADGEPLLSGGPSDFLPDETFLERVLVPDGGLVTVPSREGAPYVYVATPLVDGQIVGLVAHRAIGADAPLLAKLALEAGLPLLLATLTLLVVWLAIDRVSTRWIRRLRAVVLAHGRGSIEARAHGLEAAPLEYRELGEALNSMAEAIEQRQERLASAAAAREVLLREVHHRVKNNLQIIISLFSLVTRNADDEKAKVLIRDMLARIECLALVHHAAYRSGDVQAIGMQTFIPLLLTNVSRIFEDQAATIRVGSKVDEIALTMDETIPLAQLITEAVTNSLKHAFVDRDQGRITVRLERVAEGRAWLAIADDGVGLPADFDLRPARHRLGLSMMAGFAQQLGGTLAFRGDDGGTTISAELNYVEAGDAPAPGIAEPVA